MEEKEFEMYKQFGKNKSQKIGCFIYNIWNIIQRKIYNETILCRYKTKPLYYKLDILETLFTTDTYEYLQYSGRIRHRYRLSLLSIYIRVAYTNVLY